MSRFTATDKLFRAVILAERPHKCEWCAKQPEVLQVAHILPKGAWPRLRYQRANVLLLCFYCHMIRAHRDPLAFTSWLEEYKGKEFKNTLWAMARELPKIDLKMIALCLKQQFSQLPGAE